MKHLIPLLLSITLSLAVTGQTINNYNNFACCGSSGASINAINGTDTFKMIQSDSAQLLSQTALGINRRIFTPGKDIAKSVPVTITGSFLLPSTAAIGSRTPYVVVSDSAGNISTTSSRVPGCLASCDSLYWTVDAAGNYIQRNTGKNVTIGNTTSLGSKFNVDGTVTVTGAAQIITTDNTAESRFGYDTGTESTNFQTKASDLTATIVGNNAGGNYFYLKADGNAGTYGMNTSGAISLQDFSGGNVGIGTTTPSEKLTVIGSAYIDSAGLGLWIGDGTILPSGYFNNATALYKKYYDGADSIYAAIGAWYNNDAVTEEMGIRIEKTGSVLDRGLYYQVGTSWRWDSDERIIITSPQMIVGTTKVGIGTVGALSAQLTVGDVGSIATFNYYDGNQGDGKVLTSDADGNATWQDPTQIDYSALPQYLNDAAASGHVATGHIYVNSATFALTVKQ